MAESSNNKHEDLKRLVTTVTNQPKSNQQAALQEAKLLTLETWKDFPKAFLIHKKIIKYQNLNISYVLHVTKKKITQRALHTFTNATASQPGLPDNSNCHTHLKQQSPGKIFKHHKR